MKVSFYQRRQLSLGVCHLREASTSSYFPHARISIFHSAATKQVTYLDIPRSTSCERFIDETDPGLAVISVQPPCVPVHMRGQFCVGKLIKNPVPNRTCVYLIYVICSLVPHSNFMLHKLCRLSVWNLGTGNKEQCFKTYSTLEFRGFIPCSS